MKGELYIEGIVMLIICSASVGIYVGMSIEVFSPTVCLSSTVSRGEFTVNGSYYTYNFSVDSDDMFAAFLIEGYQNDGMVYAISESNYLLMCINNRSDFINFSIQSTPILHTENSYLYFGYSDNAYDYVMVFVDLNNTDVEYSFFEHYERIV